MFNEYKPGQFVSIGGKLCRVKRCFYACSCCEMSNDCGAEVSTECMRKLGDHNYPELIKS